MYTHMYDVELLYCYVHVQVLHIVEYIVLVHVLVLCTSRSSSSTRLVMYIVMYTIMYLYIVLYTSYLYDVHVL